MPLDPLVCSLSCRLERLEQVVCRHANELEQIRRNLVDATRSSQAHHASQLIIARRPGEPSKFAPISRGSDQTPTLGRTCSSSDPKLSSFSPPPPPPTGRQKQVQLACPPLAVKPASHLRVPFAINHYRPEHYASISLPVVQSSLQQQQQQQQLRPTTATTATMTSAATTSVAPSLRRVRPKSESDKLAAADSPELDRSQLEPSQSRRVSGCVEWFVCLCPCVSTC